MKLTARNGFLQKHSAKKLTACNINEGGVSTSLSIENIHVNKAINPGNSIKVNVFKYSSPERESYKHNVALHKFFCILLSVFQQLCLASLCILIFRSTFFIMSILLRLK